MILATDLANHLKYVGRQLNMSRVGYNRHSKQDRFLLISLLMTCADLSDQTKDWANTRLIAQQVYAEFFKQGDMEKALGKEPVVMMDREKANIPDLQLDFLNNICLPLYTYVITILKWFCSLLYDCSVLKFLFPSAKVLVDNVHRSIKMWEASKLVFSKYKQEGLTAMEILTHKDLTDEINEQLEFMKGEGDAVSEGTVDTSLTEVSRLQE